MSGVKSVTMAGLSHLFPSQVHKYDSQTAYPLGSLWPNSIRFMVRRKTGTAVASHFDNPL